MRLDREKRENEIDERMQNILTGGGIEEDEAIYETGEEGEREEGGDRQEEDTENYETDMEKWCQVTNKRRQTHKKSSNIQKRGTATGNLVTEGKKTTKGNKAKSTKTAGKKSYAGKQMTLVDAGYRRSATEDRDETGGDKRREDSNGRKDRDSTNSVDTDKQETRERGGEEGSESEREYESCTGGEGGNRRRLRSEVTKNK